MFFNELNFLNLYDNQFETSWLNDSECNVINVSLEEQNILEISYINDNKIKILPITLRKLELYKKTINSLHNICKLLNAKIVPITMRKLLLYQDVCAS